MVRNYDEIALTADDKATLYEEVDVMRFATVNPAGLPHVTPVAFAVINNEICFETDADSIKARNVNATGVGAGVVDAGETEYTEHRGVQWQGPARQVENRDRERQIERALFGTVKTVPDAEGHDRVKITLTPAHEVSWDFRKLGE